MKNRQGAKTRKLTFIIVLIVITVAVFLVSISIGRFSIAIKDMMKGPLMNPV